MIESKSAYQQDIDLFVSRVPMAAFWKDDDWLKFGKDLLESLDWHVKPKGEGAPQDRRWAIEAIDKSIALEHEAFGSSGVYEASYRSIPNWGDLGDAKVLGIAKAALAKGRWPCRPGEEEVVREIDEAIEEVSLADPLLEAIRAGSSFSYGTEESHFDNSETMRDFLESRLPEGFDMVSVDGSQAVISDGKSSWVVDAQGEGDSRSHRISFTRNNERNITMSDEQDRKKGQGPVHKSGDTAVWLNSFTPKSGPNAGKTQQVYNVTREKSDGSKYTASVPTRVNGQSITPTEAIDLFKGKPVTKEFKSGDREYLADVAVRSVKVKEWSEGEKSGVNRRMDLGLAFHKNKKDDKELYAFDIVMPTKEEPNRTVTFFRKHGGQVDGAPAVTIDAADAFKLAGGKSVRKGETELKLDRVEGNDVDGRTFYTARIGTEKISRGVDAQVLDKGRGVNLDREAEGETVGIGR